MRNPATQSIIRGPWPVSVRLLVVTLALTVAGCGLTPTRNNTPQNAAGQVPQGLDVSAPDQNPYLSSRATAPRQARELFEASISAMDEQRWSEAENLLVRITESYPELSGPHLNLGIVYHRTKRSELAEQAFARAIEVNRFNLDAYNWLALLKRQAGDFAAAEEQYLNALEVWAKHAPTHRNIGILYDLYLGQMQKALQHFKIYQFLQGDDGPDRQVNGWIDDLNRRIEQQAGLP
ncbi:tetratricopeptide repeat protein [Gilvimarinus sp. F26214L]|uniref:tetratricopeptide repeat protein n=1 Tax=Gilvimarinus sp. DZF01 TaxID=3461371 RepID=UPI0040466FC8